MKISYIDFKKYNYPIESNLLNSLKKTLSSGKYVNGQNIDFFEKRFAKFIGIKHAIGVANGTCALRIALKHLGVKKNDEVIIPANAFLSNVSSVIDNCAIPVFIDVKEDFNLNENLLEKKINKKTKVIVVVHLHGYPANLKKIIEIAKRYKIKVLEDCSQSFGSKYNKKFTGTFGDISIFSLHPLKNLHAYGDAGIICCRDRSLYKKIKSFKNHGLLNRNICSEWGCNCRLDEMQASLLNVILSKFKVFNQIKKNNAQYYNKRLSRVLKVPKIDKNKTHTYQTYTVIAKKRDKLKKFLSLRGIETLVYYPIPLHLQPASKKIKFNRKELRVSEYLSKSSLSLPCGYYLTKKEKDYIINNILEFYKNES